MPWRAMRLRKKAMPVIAIMSPDFVLMMTYTWILMATAYAIAVSQIVAMLRHRELAVATQAVYITAPGRGREKTNKKTTRAINISHSLPVFYEVPAFGTSSP